MDSIRNSRAANSPFDRIRNFTEEGEEWWSGRELGPYLGYPRWDAMAQVIKRAENACKIMGFDVASNFRYSQKISNTVGPNSLDVHLTRYGCYQVALNADSAKPQVAAAKHYFATMTRVAEVQATVIVPATVIVRPWSERFRETMLPHVRFVNQYHPGCFTIITTLVGPMLFLEDELFRHQFQPNRADLPDGSVGQCWANERRRLGKPATDKIAPLNLPLYGIDVDLCVYDNCERGEFETWFYQNYLPNKLPVYLAKKPEYRPFGELPPASVTEHVCQGLTGKPANLSPRIRKQLDDAGGFFPIGKELPAPKNPQRNFLDDLPG